MILWAGQSGYLAGAFEDKGISRGEALRRAGLTPPLPNRPVCDVVEIVDDIGLAMTGGADIAPLTSTEVLAYADGMGLDLTPWEFRVIRAMSRAYVGGVRASTAPFEPLGTKVALASAKMIIGG